MRRTILLQGELDEVPVPKLGSRGVLQAIETTSRHERQAVAGGRLDSFREEARKRAAYRLLRVARRRLQPQRIGSADFFNLTEADGEVVPDILARVGPKFRPVRVGFLLANEQSNLVDEKGPIVVAPDPIFGYWQRSWTERRVSVVVIFVPAGFGEHEPLLKYPEANEGVPVERVSGRLTLLWYLVARGFLHLTGSIDHRQLRRRLKKWDLLEVISQGQYVDRLLKVTRES